MAFNLYCNGTPSVYDYESEDGKLQEYAGYTPEELFCCGYARYFLGGNQNSLSGILLLEEKKHVKSQSSGNKNQIFDGFGKSWSSTLR